MALAIFVFFIINFIYAALSGFSDVFYRNKLTAQLDLREQAIRNNTASLGDRLMEFISNLILGIFSPPIIILTCIALTIILLIGKVL